MLFTERNFDVVDVVKAVARGIGRTPAEMALKWVGERPGVSFVLIGASRVEKLFDGHGVRRWRTVQPCIDLVA